MHFKKILAGIVAVSVLSISSASTFAANSENIKPINSVEQSREIMPVNIKLNSVDQTYFKSFTGTVKEIRDYVGVEGSKFISLEDKDGVPATILVSKNTYILNNAEITEGAVITGFYNANAPMLMIYPAQYNAEVVAVNSKDQNIKVDMFDKDLISSDKTLKLNISEKTDIILQDGKPFDGELANRKLVVIYGASTRSIPAQTTPEKIVVLFEKAVPPVHILTDEEKAVLTGNVSSMNIVVNNKRIEAPAAYTNEQGTIMVPLRAIAEALHFDVFWDDATQSIRVGKGISLTIGEDNYNYMKTAPIQLGTAPELANGSTFVPLSFFTKVARMNNAYMFESQIVVDDGEKMQ